MQRLQGVLERLLDARRAILSGAIALAPFLLAPALHARAAQEPAREPSSVSDDAGLASQLEAIFRRIPELAAVRVSVQDGVVELTGQVPDGQAVDAAEEIAREMEAVVWVHESLDVETNVARRLLPSLDRMSDGIRDLLARLPLFLLALAVVVAFWLLARWRRPFESLYARAFSSQLARDVARQVVRTLLVVLGLFLALEILDATQLAAAAIGAAGLVGLVLSLAFRDIVENYLASIILSIRRPFQRLDLVRIDDQLGKVIRMTTSETILMTLEGNHLRIPNATIFKGVLENFTRNPLRRFDFAVGVGVDEDLDRARELGLDALRRLPGVVPDPEAFVLVEALGDSTVNLRFFGWVDQRAADFQRVSSAAIQRVKSVLDAHSIDMPVPIYQVRLARESGRERAPRPRPEDSRSPDVSVDSTIEEQIDREEALSREPDLLESGAR
jgi:small-conductance mechanosensitive channel